MNTNILLHFSTFSRNQDTKHTNSNKSINNGLNIFYKLGIKTCHDLNFLHICTLSLDLVILF